MCVSNYKKGGVCYHKTHGPRYINLTTTEEEVSEKVTDFFHVFSVPQFLGAVDVTHTNIKQSTVNFTCRIKRESRFSLNVQACCDYKYIFKNVVVK